MNAAGQRPIQPSDADFQLWRVLDHTRFLVGRAREKELAGYGLTPEQSHVLDILVVAGGTVTINEIVDITQRQHHSISTLIARMSRLGLVSKKKDTSDLRKWDVSITRKGEKVFKALTRESIHKIFTALPEERREDFKANLLALMEKAREVLGQPPVSNIYRQNTPPKR